MRPAQEIIQTYHQLTEEQNIVKQVSRLLKEHGRTIEEYAGKGFRSGGFTIQREYFTAYKEQVTKLGYTITGQHHSGTVIHFTISW